METSLKIMEERQRVNEESTGDKSIKTDILKEEIRSRQKECDALNHKRGKLSKEVGSLQKKVTEVEDEVFKGFLKKTKMSSVQEFEGHSVQEIDELQRERAEV